MSGSPPPHGGTTRRLVTARDAAGRSHLRSDEQLDLGPAGAIELWQTPAPAPGMAAPFYPDAGGTLFRLVELPPKPRSIDPDPQAGERAAAGFFASVVAADCRVDTARDAWMHQTPTTDYVAVLSGEVILLLDDGPAQHLAAGDTVIQRGTNHAWQNAGDRPARLLVVMLGASVAAAENPKE